MDVNRRSPERQQYSWWSPRTGNGLGGHTWLGLPVHRCGLFLFWEHNGGVASQAQSIYCHILQFYVLYRMFFGHLFLTRYHRHSYFCMSQIFFTLFAICSQFSKICTHEIFVSRVYPSRFGNWTFSLLFHYTMALLHHSKWVNGHLPGPTVPLSADVPPSTIQQANYKCLVSQETDVSASSEIVQ